MNVNFSKNSGTGLQPLGRSSHNPLIEATLLIIVCVLFAWFIILPKKADRDQKQRELAVVQDEQSQTADKLATLKSLIESLKAHQDQIVILDEALPLSAKIINAQLLIEELAKSVSVTVGDISISGDSTAVVAGDKTLLADFYGASRSLHKLSGSVYVIGTFSQLEAFLQKLETSGRLMDITEFSIDSGLGGNLNLKMTINVYYFAS